MRKRFMFIVPLALLLIGGLAACGNSEEVVATVNGEEIYESEWQETVDQMSMQYEQMGLDLESEEGAQYLAMIEEQALESLIQQKALVQVALADGISVSDETVNEEIDAIKGQYPSEEDFVNALEENNFTQEEFHEMLLEELIIDEYLNSKIDDVDVDSEDVEALYEDYVAQTEEQGVEPDDFEDIKEDLEAHIAQEQEQQQTQEIIQQAVEQADVERHIEL